MTAETPNPILPPERLARAGRLRRVLRRHARGRHDHDGRRLSHLSRRGGRIALRGGPGVRQRDRPASPPAGAGLAHDRRRHQRRRARRHGDRRRRTPGERARSSAAASSARRPQMGGARSPSARRRPAPIRRQAAGLSGAWDLDPARRGRQGPPLRRRAPAGPMSEAVADFSGFLTPGSRRAGPAGAAGARRELRDLPGQGREAAAGGAPGVEQAQAQPHHRQALGAASRARPAIRPRSSRAVEKAGYRASLFDPATARAAEDAEGRRLTLALGVAGFGAGNVMMFSVPIWAGLFGQELDASTRAIMYWLSAIVATPCALYAGRIFFQSAWRSLRRGKANMDVPISIGVLLTLIVSFSETIQGGRARLFRRRGQPGLPASDRPLARPSAPRARPQAPRATCWPAGARRPGGSTPAALEHMRAGRAGRRRRPYRRGAGRARAGRRPRHRAAPPASTTP